MKTYNILTLGLSGAGKTVYLASLFKQLSTQGEQGFFLEIKENIARQKLNQYYTEIITGESWPEATRRGEIKEWVFDCCVKTQDLNKYSVCQFVYKDYSGALLSELAADETSELNFPFEEAVKEADAVLAILDGQKLFQFMQNPGHPSVQYWTLTELPTLLHLIQNCGKQPVHFIISKWDLIENHGGWNLTNIIDSLRNKVPEFDNVVLPRLKAKCPMRIIPVSSLGMKFARLEGNEMKKISGAIPQPYQVEIPFACVLIDGLTAQMEEIKKKQAETQNRSTEVKPKFSLFDQVNQVLSGTVYSLFANTVNTLLPEKYQFNNDIIQTILDTTKQTAKSVENHVNQTRQEKEKAEEAARKEQEKLNRQKQEDLQKVDDEVKAFNYVVKRFLDLVKILDQPQNDRSDLRDYPYYKVLLEQKQK
ncbi:MAG: hypothetical protein EAZ76_02500 [Nostocales cyanobacterium]|nr:MAG: hypothetical protein EAZ87_05200 [Nostocales cyanobacterium]TAF20005.1 MAG: hypothetical protein EAZ76_02500 [Nostocales cyanobacterium]